MSATGVMTEVFSDPPANTQAWLPSVSAPHGIAMDPNGYLYIGENVLDFSSFPPNQYSGTLRYDCDGNLVGGATNNYVENIYAFNYVSVGQYLYGTQAFVPGVPDRLGVYDLCDGTPNLIGYVNLGGTSSALPGADHSSWGIAYNPNDGLLYVTDNYTPGEPGEGDIYAIDPANPTGLGSIWQTNATIAPILSGFDALLGITFDSNNNMYFNENGYRLNTGSATYSRIYRYTLIGSTWTQTAVIDDPTNDGTGWNNNWGIVWSPESNKLLVTSLLEDCVAVINPTTMAYENALSIPHVPGGWAKGIGLINEGCYNGPSTINVNMCSSSTAPVLLRDFLDCPVCGGTWTRTSGSGGTYDACSQTFDPAGATNTAFTFSGNNDQSGPFNLTVNISIADIALSTSVVCNASTGNINLTVTNGFPPFAFQWSNGATTEDLSNIPNGNYTVTVTDATGVCEAVTTVSVNCTTAACPNPLPLCPGESYTLTADAGWLNYQWFFDDGLGGGQVTISGATNRVYGTANQLGTYTWTAEDADGCPIEGCCPVVLEIGTCTCPAPPSVVITQASTTVCGTNMATFNYTVANGPAMLVHNGGGTLSVTNLPNGSSTFTYTPSAGDAGNTVTISATIADPDGAGLCLESTDMATVTVLAIPTVTDPANHALCAGEATMAVTFAGTATRYDWTNDNAAIGLAASGTGNIASFTAANSTGSALVATIMVVPRTAGPDGTIGNADDCVGASESFTITVNPTPALPAGPLSLTNACPVTTADLTTLNPTDANGTTGTLSYHTTLAGASNPANNTTDVVADETAVAAPGTYYIRKTTADGCFDYVQVDVAETNCCTLAATATAICQTPLNGGYDLAVTLDYTGSPGGVINVTLSTGEMQASAVTTASSDGQVLVTFTGLSNTGAAGVSITAAFAADPTCNDAITYNAPVSCCPVVEAGQPQALCSTQSLEIGTLGASITPTGGGTWSSSGDGTFVGGMALDAATAYQPGPNDVAAGTVTLTLTSTACGESDSVTLSILKVNCGAFPWNGN